MDKRVPITLQEVISCCEQDRYDITNIVEWDGRVTDKMNKYMGYLENKLIKIKFDENEQYKYHYRPKILSLDLYKTDKLWFLIMKLNKIQSISTFTPDTLYVLDPKELAIINDIYVKEDIGTRRFI